jgi:hypothetical protein
MVEAAAVQVPLEQMAQTQSVAQEALELHHQSLAQASHTLAVVVVD